MNQVSNSRGGYAGRRRSAPPRPRVALTPNSEDRRPLVAVLGMSIKRTPIAVREPLSFTPRELEPALRRMASIVDEGAIVSTCNRVELYAASAGAASLRARLKRFWLSQRDAPAAVDAHLYYFENEEAVRHLFSVASGLDSAIFGEPQILGQVREALDMARAAGSAGPVLSALLQAAVRAGRHVRTETNIGRSAASVSYAAVELASGVLGDLRDASVLLVGTGKMGEAAARNLLSKGVARLAVAGRTPDRARKLALECGDMVSLAELESALPVSDIVISCTSAPHHVITAEMVRGAMATRARRPLFLIDIAVPRDIEPDAGEVEGVRLFNIDDLEARVVSNLAARRREARKAASVIDDEVAAFERWLSIRGAVPTITALRNRAEAIRHAELSRSAAVLARLAPADRRRVEALTLAIEKKLLHGPIAELRAAAASGQRAEADRAVRHLFRLE